MTFTVPSRAVGCETDLRSNQAISEVPVALAVSRSDGVLRRCATAVPQQAVRSGSLGSAGQASESAGPSVVLGARGESPRTTLASFGVAPGCGLPRYSTPDRCCRVPGVRVQPSGRRGRVDRFVVGRRNGFPALAGVVEDQHRWQGHRRRAGLPARWGCGHSRVNALAVRSPARAATPGDCPSRQAELTDVQAGDGGSHSRGVHPHPQRDQPGRGARSRATGTAWPGRTVQVLPAAGVPPQAAQPPRTVADLRLGHGIGGGVAGAPVAALV